MSFPRPDFTKAVIEAAKQHALDDFPNESCGLIINGEYVRCENKSPTPLTDFRIEGERIIEAGSYLQAVIHSHPHPFSQSPSAADMKAQMDMGCIFGIVPCKKNEVADIVFWGDFKMEGELIGRNFLHGVDDCYTQVRGWLWQNKGIYLPDVPRDEDWWKNGEDLYSSFEKFGFKLMGREIDPKEAREGDCILGRVLSKVSNHAGVLLNGNLVQHHIMQRYSRREAWGPWKKNITHWLRHETLMQ